jgi:SAM-dependent methyltransferase
VIALELVDLAVRTPNGAAVHERDAGATTIVPDVAAVIATLAAGQTVIDCGCFGWRLADACASSGHRLVGLDRVEPPGRPPGAAFARLDGAQAALPGDVGDLVVASHVLEHVAEPVPFFAELVRLARPGGLLWVEAPSDLSAERRASDHPTDNRFDSFWDDPTHVRPYTPAALYRLALSCQCLPLACARAETGGIPVARMLARKPLQVSGRPATTYVSLLGVPPGLAAAWRATWPDLQAALQEARFP